MKSEQRVLIYSLKGGFEGIPPGGAVCCFYDCILQIMFFFLKSKSVAVTPVSWSVFDNHFIPIYSKRTQSPKDWNKRGCPERFFCILSGASRRGIWVLLICVQALPAPVSLLVGWPEAAFTSHAKVDSLKQQKGVFLQSGGQASKITCRQDEAPSEGPGRSRPTSSSLGGWSLQSLLRSSPGVSHWLSGPPSSRVTSSRFLP